MEATRQNTSVYYDSFTHWVVPIEDSEEVNSGVLQAVTDNQSGGLITIETNDGYWYAIQYDLIHVEHNDNEYYLATIEDIERATTQDEVNDCFLDMYNKQYKT